MAETVADQNEQTLTKLNDLFIAAVDHPTTKDFITNATKDFEFREGKQWTSTEKAELTKRGQPDIVENEIHYKVNATVGRYKKQKTKIIFRGRNVETDEPTANILSDLTLHVLQRSNFEFEEAETFHDGIVCGAGYIEPYVEFDEAFQPEVKIRNVSCLDVFVDPYSHQYDLSDAHYVCIAKWVHLAEAKALYPDKKLEIDGFFTRVVDHGNLSSFDGLRNENYVDVKNKRVRLVEVRYKEKTKQRVLLMSTPEMGSQVIRLNGKSSEKKLLKQYPDAKVIEKLVDSVKVGVFCGDIMLEEVKELPHDYKSLFMIPYYVYRKKNGEPYGIVRFLIDPQTEINKRRSKALHLLNTNQAIFEENTVRDEDELKTEIAKPDGLIKVMNKDKFELVKNIEVAQTQIGLLNESKQAMDRIAGIPVEPVQSEQIRSGIGLARKQAVIDIPITPIFENLRRTRLVLGKHIYELIRQYYTEEKMFYILDDANKARQVALTNDAIANMRQGIYDVIVEEMPDTTTLQDEQFQMVTQLLQSFNLPPQLAMSMFPLVIQLSQLRDKQNILQKFEQMMQPSPILPKMALNINWDALYPAEKAVFAEMFGRKDLAQMEMQQPNEPSFVTKEKAGLQKTQMKVQGDMSKGQEDPRKAEQEMMLDYQKHQMSMQQKQQEHELKMQQKMAEMQLKQFYDDLARQQEILNAQNNPNTARQDKRQSGDNKRD